MLKLIAKKGAMLRRCPLTAGQRVSRRYRRANIRRIEYKKLKAIVPSISARNKVTKVEVIEEAIKYIDELHKALAARVPFMHGNFPPPFMGASPQCVLAHMLRSTPVAQTNPTALPSHPLSQSVDPRLRVGFQPNPNSLLAFKQQFNNPTTSTASLHQLHHRRLDSTQSLSLNAVAKELLDRRRVNTLSNYPLQSPSTPRGSNQQLQASNLKP